MVHPAGGGVADLPKTVAHKYGRQHQMNSTQRVLAAAIAAAVLSAASGGAEAQPESMYFR